MSKPAAKSAATQSKNQPNKAGQTKVRKKVKEAVINAKVYIQASFNNTLVSITDLDGNCLSWGSCGSSGFKGSRKSTPYAAQIAAKKVAAEARDIYGVRSVEVYIKGPGAGRDAAARALSEFFRVSTLIDVTGIPHNGCRAPKERRV